ncbi:MAG: hypothetical protein ACJAZ2_000346 [Glaciecola sp.]|jgi:hypothetical protein
MVRIFSAVSALALMLSGCGCGDGSVDHSEELITSAERGAYKMQVKVETDLLIKEISDQYDLVRLSYAHGIATSEQLKRENLNFIDLNNFVDLIAEYGSGELVPSNEEAKNKIQKISQKTPGDLKDVTGADRKVLESSVAALCYNLFVDDVAFKSLDVEQFEKGIIDAWGGQEIEGVNELLLSYYNYKGLFLRDLGMRFLEKNKLREEVTQTASGLQYEVISEIANIEEKPGPDGEVTVHYHGELLDGKVFDSSYNRGEAVSFSLNQVIPGWTEGLQLMSLDSKYRFYIPYQLAYGERGKHSIPGFSVLIFDVELLELN